MYRNIYLVVSNQVNIGGFMHRQSHRARWISKPYGDWVINWKEIYPVLMMAHAFFTQLESHGNRRFHKVYKNVKKYLQTFFLSFWNCKLFFSSVCSLLFFLIKSVIWTCEIRLYAKDYTCGRVSTGYWLFIGRYLCNYNFFLLVSWYF